MRLGILLCSLLIGFLAVSNEIEAASTANSEKTVFIGRNDILDLMKEALTAQDENRRADFNGNRHPITGNLNRGRMEQFISYKMSQTVGLLGGSDDGHLFQKQTFETTIINSANNQPTSVTGTNVIAVIKGSNDEAKDQPLMILANYDTDTSTTNLNFNPVENNGAGVATLLVLANFIAKELKSEAYKLENTLIFVATDLSFRKYYTKSEAHMAPNSTTGADQITNRFLPGFLGSRKFRGAIVLDNILNYQEEARTETAQDFSKTYSAAYQELAKDDFKGNFLALVARPSELDRDLQKRIVLGWDKATKQPKDSHANHDAEIEAKLLSFVHSAEDESGEGFLYFLQSDQYSFWNHHSDVRATGPSYPAILLTDTGKYRAPICNPCSNIDASTTPENLAFAHRTMLTLYNVVKDLQTSDGSGGSGKATSSEIVILTSIFALFLRYLFALNM